MVVAAIAHGGKDSQVLQSLLIPQAAISPGICKWSQYGGYDIKVARRAG